MMPGSGHDHRELRVQQRPRRAALGRQGDGIHVGRRRLRACAAKSVTARSVGLRQQLADLVDVVRHVRHGDRRSRARRPDGVPGRELLAGCIGHHQGERLVQVRARRTASGRRAAWSTATPGHHDVAVAAATSSSLELARARRARNSSRTPSSLREPVRQLDVEAHEIPLLVEERVRQRVGHVADPQQAAARANASRPAACPPRAGARGAVPMHDRSPARLAQQVHPGQDLVAACTRDRSMPANSARVPPMTATVSAAVTAT